MNVWVRAPRKPGHVRPRSCRGMEVHSIHDHDGYIGRAHHLPLEVDGARRGARRRSPACLAGGADAGQPLQPQPGPLSKAFVEALHDPLAGAFGKLPNPVEVHLGAAAEMYLDRVRQLAEGAGQRIVESLDEGLAERARLGLQWLAGVSAAGQTSRTAPTSATTSAIDLQGEMV